MAWPATDFTKRSFAELAGDMSALCIALNERQEALGQILTIFNYNGGTKTKPSESDLSGMSLLGADLQDNMKDLQTKCVSIVDTAGRERFTTTSGGETLWTSSALLTSVGLGSFPAEPSILNATDWERIRLYLDELIYVIIGPEIIELTIDYKIGRDSTEQDSWDDMLADTTTGDFTYYNGASYSVKRSLGYNSSFGQYQSNSEGLSKYNFTFETSKYDGTTIGTGKAFIQETAIDATSDLGYSFGGSSNTVTSSSPTTVTVSGISVGIITDQTVNGNLTTSLPGAPPFDGDNTHDPLGEDVFGVIGIDLNNFTSPTGLTNSGLKFWINLSSALTDQA